METHDAHTLAGTAGRSRLSRESPAGFELHDRAVLRAEVRCLVHALAPYRVLSRRALERVAGAERWHEGGFDRALAAALDAGEIRRLPLGFYALSSPVVRRSEHAR